jgi:hypothetical protein
MAQEPGSAQVRPSDTSTHSIGLDFAAQPHDQPEQPKAS